MRRVELVGAAVICVGCAAIVCVDLKAIRRLLEQIRERLD